MSLGACAPCLGEEIYTTEHRAHGEGRDITGEGEAGTQEVDGPSPQPVLKEALLPRVLKKRRKSYNQRGRVGWRVRSCPVYTQHCKHTRSILHVLQSGVCESVHLSVSALDLRSFAPLLPHRHLPAPPWEQRLEQVWSPDLARASRQGLSLSPTLAPESCVYVCEYVHVCTWGACVQVCTKGEGHCQRLGQVGLPEARPAGGLAHK